MVKITFDLENLNVKVMAKVKPIGHIWGLEFNRYVCFSFCGNRTTFGWDIAFHIWPWKFKVKVMAKLKSDGYIWDLMFNWYACFSFRGNLTIFVRDIANYIFDFENSRPRSWPRSNLMVTFEAFSSIDMFAFRFVAIAPFLAEMYSKFHIWPWKFKVKVMAKVKPDGHIWGLEFNRCIWFSFRDNRTIFGWDIANSIFDLENSRWSSRRKSTKI